MKVQVWEKGCFVYLGAYISSVLNQSHFVFALHRNCTRPSSILSRSFICRGQFIDALQ